MATLVRVGAAVGMALGAWLSIGALAVAPGAGGATRIGVMPSVAVLVAVAATASIAVFAFRRAPDRLLPSLFLLVLVLPWLPIPVPTALLVWVGPMVMPVWLGVAVALVAGLDLHLPRRAQRLACEPRRAAIVAGCIAFGLYALAAHRLHGNGLIPGGDEPHYLVVTQSLLLDRDLAIENNHARGDYRQYIDIPLKPDFLKRGTDGRIYSVHAPGLPALLIPAFAIAGYPGAVWCLALVASVGVALAWHVAWRVTGSAAAAWFGCASVALSTSFLFHAFAIYPDVVASVVFLATIWALASSPTRPGWLGLGSAIALLPWLHTRFAVIALMLGLCAIERVIRRPDRVRALLAFSAVPAASALAWFAFFWAIYGTPDPAAPYGGSAPTRAEYLWRGLVGLLFDHQFGLVANAPVYGVSLLGLGVMLAGRKRRGGSVGRDRLLAVHILAVAVPYACVAAAFPMWWAGASAPARFLVPLLLPLSIPAAAAWASVERRATRAFAFGLLALSAAITVALLSVQGGWLAFNVRDGYSRLWDWASPLADVTVALPSLFRQTPGGALGRAGVWVAASTLAWLAVRAIDAREARSRATLGLATLAAAWLVAVTSLSVTWAAGREPVTRTTTSASWLLRHYRPWLHTWAVHYAGDAGGGPGAARVPPDRALGSLRLDWESRRPRQPGDLVWLGPLPAGDYTLRFDLDRPTEGALRATVGRHDTTLERWDVAGLSAGPHERSLRLPVPVVGLVVRAEPPAGEAVSIALVRPASVAGRTGNAIEPARQAVRTDAGTAFLLNEGAFFESSGFWLRPGRPARVALVARQPAPVVRVAIRNAPVANTLHLRVDGWRETLTLTPGEERVVTVPSRGDAPVAVVEFLAEQGFQPSLVEPSSDDQRWLGCWVELR